MTDLQTLFGRVRGEIQSKASASEIETALEEMTSKIQESANHRSRLQRLAHTLGKDKNSPAAMKRLQIELEQVNPLTFAKKNCKSAYIHASKLSVHRRKTFAR